MYSYKLINQDEEELDLSSNSLFDLVSITGLTEYKRTIYSSSPGTISGSYINGSHVEPREISITLKPKFIDTTSVDLCSDAVNRFLTKTEYIVFEWTKNENTTWTIDGMIEAISDPRFEKDCLIHIDITCPYPFFKSTAIKSHGLYVYPDEPLSVTNNGNDPIGCRLRFRVREYPILSITFSNLSTGKHLTLENITKETSASSNLIVIETTKGKESVINHTADKDLISSFDFSSDWIQLKCGINTIQVMAELEEGVDIHDADPSPTVLYYEVFI